MAALAKAQLIELNQKFTDLKPGGQTVEVQFNPETLKVTYANQIEQPKGGDQASGTGGRQFVGAGTTKLALQLWFDVTAMEQDPVDDVRRLTQKVVYFMTPQPSDEDANRRAPPGIRFQWGSFLFDGMVDGIEQSLEFFSPDGKPLRASISLSLSQQKILEAKFPDKVPVQPGRRPLTGCSSPPRGAGRCRGGRRNGGSESHPAGMVRRAGGPYRPEAGSVQMLPRPPGAPRGVHAATTVVAGGRPRRGPAAGVRRGERRPDLHPRR